MSIEVLPPYAERGNGRSFASICSVSINENNYVFLIGGMLGKCRQKTTQRFNLSSKSWENDIPRMKRARSNFATCFVGGYIYAFCGLAEDDD